MAPSRGKGKARARSSSTPKTASSNSRRTPRSTRETQDMVPGVYDEMLAEASRAESELYRKRPLKRRRLLREVSIHSQEAPQKAPVKYRSPSHTIAQLTGGTSYVDPEAANDSTHPRQTVEDSSVGSDESDFSFEDVDLAGPAGSGGDADSIADVSISVVPSITGKGPARAKRKPATVAEKAYRLLVHKVHLLCLLGHCVYLNRWCSNAVVQHNLRELLDGRMISYLNPKVTETQFQRNRSFMDGIEMAADVFIGRFRVNVSGIRKARWSGEGEDITTTAETEPMDRSDFIRASKELTGSQDTGNQLFCAILRSAGVDARLVCSLQVLPFASVPKAVTPQKIRKPTIFAIASDTDHAANDASADDISIRSSTSIGKIPSVRRRLGQPSFAAEQAVRPSPEEHRKRSIRKLSYPIFWIEAFNPAHQKWIPLDPIVTGTVNKPFRIEPPASYGLNQLTYAIALEEDGVVRDVTRRYAKAYNAKTRRQRVEACGEDGAEWLKRALRPFRRRGKWLDRDQVEDAELTQREAREGLPGNVLHFKGHPVYALERHLKRNEVLYPRREVGKFNAGTAARSRIEAVFRRQDVVACRSADKWYRMGREVKRGEQPLKYVAAARSSRRASTPVEAEADAGAREQTGLYAPFQTDLYVPPPVVRGRIPKNAFGNLDLYIASMLPAGGVHIRHSLARQAARILALDYADAVTGFTFKGRHGTAVIEGVVVAAECADAVEAVLEGLEQEVLEDESRGRSLEALRLWKRFIVGLRIAERVSAYGSGRAMENIRAEMDEVEAEVCEVVHGGGFVLNDAEKTALPTAGRFSLGELNAKAKASKSGRRKVVEASSEDGDEHDEEYMHDAEPEAAGSRRSNRRTRRLAGSDDDLDEMGGGEGSPPDRPFSQHLNGEAGDFEPAEQDPVPEGSGQDFQPVQDKKHGGAGGLILSRDGFEARVGSGEPAKEDANLDHSGGGFLPETDGSIADGGGFVPEDDVEGHIDGEEFLREVTAAEMDAGRRSFPELERNGGGGSVPEDATVESSLPGRGPDGESFFPPSDAEEVVKIAQICLPETVNLAPAFTFEEPALLESTLPEGVAEQAERLTNQAAGLGDQSIGEKPAAEIAEEEDDDRGSLLSQDPDDEDAEPDWLESD